MTKAELIDRIARSRDLPPEVTKKVIAKVLDLAFAELAAYFVRARVTRTNNPRFTFPKFGTFTKKQRSGRRGVNPRTLEPIEIEGFDTVDFKPSVELKRSLNEANVAKPSPSKGKAQPKQVSVVAGPQPKVKVARSGGKRSARPGRGSPPGSLAASAPVAGELGKARAAGPGGRKLVTREEAELELPSGEPLLPDAPLQRIARRRRAESSSDPGLGGTGTQG